MNWLIAANSNIYDHSSSFEHFGFIDWRQGANKFNIDDIVYIYSTKPKKKAQFKCIVQKINLNNKEIRDDKKYWLNLEEYHKSINGYFMRLNLIEQVDSSFLTLENLLKQGLKSAPQGPQILRGKLLQYIEQHFNDLNQNNYYPEMIEDDELLYEGIKRQITVNKYERSSIAREKCIEFHGLSCSVCDLIFEQKYGAIGRDFIHVHHLTPISEIGKNYKIDYKQDLIPVCPNCHAMLHRKLNDEYISIDKLRAIINR